MIPIRLQMQNFLSYRGLSDIFDFRTIHVACLTGANGAGKSSFLEAMHWAIWGEARVKEKELISQGASDMSVELVLMVNHVYYRIQRSYTVAKRNPGAQLSIDQAFDATITSWSPLTKSSVKETQAFITDEVVGMTYDVFQNSAYLRQGQADAFARLAPAERRNMLSAILEIDQYTTYQDRARTAQRRYDTDIAQIKGQMQSDEALVLQLEATQQQLSDAERRLQSALAYRVYAENLIQTESVAKQIQQTRQQLTQIETRQHELQAEHTEIEHALAQRADLTEQYQTLLEAEARYQHFEDVRSQFDALQQEKTNLDRQYESLTQQQQREQDRLTQQVATIHADLSKLAELSAEQHALTQALHHATDIDAQLVTLQHAQQHTQQHLNEYEQRTQRVHLLQEQLAKLQQQYEQLTRLVADIDRVTAEIAVSEQAQHQLEQLTQQRTTYSEAVAQASVLCTRLHEQAKTLKAKQQTLAIGEACPTCQTMMDTDHFNHAQQVFEREIEHLRNQYTEQRTVQKTAQQQIDDIDTQLHALSQRVKAGNALRAQLGSLQTKHQQQQQCATDLATMRGQIAELIANNEALSVPTLRAQLSQHMADIQDALTRKAQADGQRARLHTVAAELARLAQQQVQLGLLETRLHELAQPSPALQDLDAQRTSLQARIEALAYDATAMQLLRSHIQTLQPVRDQYANILKLDTRKKAVDEMLADVTSSIQSAQTTLDHYRHQHDELIRTQNEQKLLLSNRALTIPSEQMLKTAKAEVDAHQDIVSQLKSKLRTIADAQTRLADLQEQLQSKVTLSNHMKTLSEAFGRNGIQGMIIEEFAVPALEEEANRILSQMSNNQLYLTIKMQRPTQNQGTVERLDIVVSDAQGTRQLEAFSGGEAFRISFALRIALSKLLARRAGRRLETLIIDEGFGTQDDEGREHLVEAINSVSEEFRIILVITHIQEVRDLFPVQINIKQIGNRSTWEVLS